MLKLSNLFVINIKVFFLMSNSKPTIYIRKRCDYCIQLLGILKRRSDIRGNFIIISIDENPFPKYVKAVPCMVSGDELYSASDIFAMLEDSNEPDTKSGSCSVNNSGGGGEGGEPQCDINGYCKSDTCLGFSAIEGDAPGGSLDSYYSTVEQTDGGNNSMDGGKDEYKSKKQASFDSDYERMMQERGEVNGGGNMPQNINFAR